MSYYVCKTRHGGQKWFARQKGIELQPCGMPFVRAEAVEEAAWRALETVLISPQIVLDQVGSPSHQIALLEKELQGIEQERGELVKRQSRLLDLYERADRTLLEELDARMARNKAAQAVLDRRGLECQERIGYYRQQQVDPDQVHHVLSQIEEIIRFATPEHRQEIFRSLFSEMIVKPDKTLEVSAKLPTAGVIQRLSVALCPSQGHAEEVYQNTPQENPVIWMKTEMPLYVVETETMWISVYQCIKMRAHSR